MRSGSSPTAQTMLSVSEVWLGGVGGDALEMRLGQVALDMRPLLRGLGQKVDMHLVGAELRALMAKMGKIERDRVVLGLAEGERRP